jgi:transposase
MELMLWEGTVNLASKQERCLNIGLDIGESCWVMGVLELPTGNYRSFCFRDGLVEEKCYQKVHKFIQEGYRVHILFEAGWCGFTPARRFHEMGASVSIVPVNKLEVVQSGKKKKTDRLDAKFMATKIGTEHDEFPRVYVPAIDEECKRSVLRELKRINKDIARNNNRIISILARWPIPTIREHHAASTWIQLTKEWREDGKIPSLLPESELWRIEDMAVELALLEENRKKWQKRIREMEGTERQEGKDAGYAIDIDIMRQYTGIGEEISRTFSWYLGDLQRFKNGKHLASYFGLTPTPWSSNKHFREQGISKDGNGELRRLAIQLAWLWKYHQPDSAISKKWADRLKRKGRGRKVAIVAMARQLVVAIYRLLVHGEELEGAKKQKGKETKLPSKAQFQKQQTQTNQDNPQEACNE